MSHSVFTKNLSKKLVSNGLINPTNLTFPSFLVDENGFKNTLLNVIQEQIEFYVGRDFDESILEQNVNPDFLEQIGFTPLALQEKILNEHFESMIKSKINQIQIAGGFQDVGTLMKDKAQLAATLLMIKVDYPSIFKNISLVLDFNKDNKDFISDIKKMVNEQHFDVVHEIRLINNEFAQKHFPKEFDFLIQNDKIDVNKLKF